MRQKATTLYLYLSSFISNKSIHDALMNDFTNLAKFNKRNRDPPW